MCRTKVKEILTPADMVKIFESDFTERTGEDVAMSQEDLHFLAKLKQGIKQEKDGHLVMPLPFKEERPILPNNKACAEHRLQCLKRRFRKDGQYYKDYMTFMADIIASQSHSKGAHGVKLVHWAKFPVAKRTPQRRGQGGSE